MCVRKLIKGKYDLGGEVLKFARNQIAEVKDSGGVNERGGVCEAIPECITHLPIVNNRENNL